MPDPNTAPATPALDPTPAPSTTDSGAAPVTPAQPTADAPFLKVNDRQVYKTQDEAIRAYGEASSRIAQLSPWEALAKEGFTPEQVQTYLDELAQLRASQNQPAQPAAPAQPQMSPEWKSAIDYMKSLGVFPTADQLTKLQTQVESLSQTHQGEQSARVDAARTSGETIFQGLLKDSGITLDENAAGKMRDRIEDAIVRDSRDASGNLISGSLEDRFIRGDAAERTSILKEQFQFFTQFGDLYAKRQTAQLVDQKAAAQAATPRPLPATNSPVPVPAQPGKGLRDPGLNQRVAALMDAEQARRGGPLL